MRWKYSWVDATGKKGHVRGVDIFKVRDGSICEKLSYVKGSMEQGTLMRQIIAMGGGGFSMEPDNLALDQYILKQAHKPRPQVCFVPTASGDAERYILNFYKACGELECQPSYLSLFQLPIADLESFFLEKDVIYVGGGNTRSLMALCANGAWIESSAKPMRLVSFWRGLVPAPIAGSNNARPIPFPVI